MNHEATLSEHILAFDNARVLVIGDPICDWYSFGRVERISQEAPVPVYLEDAKEMRDGGALNVYRNVKALGGQARMIVPDKPWSVKHRYMVGHHQVFRHDVDVDHVPFTVEGLAEHLDWCRNVVLADYGKGTLSPAFCAELIEECRKREKHVLVDPRGGDWEKYCGAAVVFPNEGEMDAYLNHRPTRPVFPFVVNKRGAQGVRLMVDGMFFRDFRARARQVFDVTGAGDTVIATFATATWNPNYSLIQAIELANIAAGIVVGKLGTSTVTREELLQAVEDDDGPTDRSTTIRGPEGQTITAGAPGESGREYRAQAVEIDWHRDPLSPAGGGAAPGGEVPAGG